MGLHAVTWALALVAWPFRKPGLVPDISRTSPETVPQPLIGCSDNIQPEADCWLRPSPVPSPGHVPFASATIEETPTWFKTAESDDGTCPGLVQIPTDGSAQAYFEWRMGLGLVESDEERVMYQDYRDQCLLGGYNPLSMVTWCKGMVACGCTKRTRVDTIDPDGRRRQPNMLDWPTRIGET